MVKIMFAVQSYDLFQKFPNISTKKQRRAKKDESYKIYKSYKSYKSDKVYKGGGDFQLNSMVIFFAISIFLFNFGA